MEVKGEFSIRGGLKSTVIAAYGKNLNFNPDENHK
jgi:hypothetical protein